MRPNYIVRLTTDDLTRRLRTTNYLYLQKLFRKSSTILFQRSGQRSFLTFQRNQMRLTGEHTNLAQEKEFPEVVQSIGKFVDLAVTSLSLPPRIDAVGQARRIVSQSLRKRKGEKEASIREGRNRSRFNIQDHLLIR